MNGVLAEIARRLARMPRRRGMAAGLAADYAGHREGAALRSRRMAAAGSEIGELPPPADPARRERATGSLKVFAEMYFARVFYRPWSRFHLKALARLQRAIDRGGCYVLAWPRGGGKSALMRTAALWAVLTGRRRYVALIAASAPKAHAELAKIKAACETNETLIDDWPEALYPVACLERVAQRQRAQKCMGVHTRIQWLDNLIVMPTIPNSPSSGSAIYSAGLTGAEVRGPSHYTAGGEVIRPDLALIDDPQTRESAKSPTQTQDRLDLIKGDVLGQAGDGKPMAALAAVTVIKPADLSSRLLDREEHPDWQGEVVPMVVAWPSEAGQKLWDQYARIRAEDVAAGGSGARATAFYAEHRDAMDSGVAVSDAARHSDGELSAIQHAYNWRCRVGDEVFWAEYQNAPKVAESVSGEVTPLARILKQLSGLPRGTVPRRAGHVTAFIDVGKKILYWMACAWADDFTGWIVDYGTYPDQGRWHFRGDDAQHTIRRKHQGVVDEEAVRLAIEACGAWLLGRDWPREDGPPQRVERLHIDRGYMRPSVELACRRLTGNVLPSAGQGVGPAQRAMSEYRRRPGERIGHYWWMPNVRGTSELRHVRPDTNYWKSLVHQRLAMGLAEKGALSLPGRNPTEHQLLAEHLTAEVCHPTYGRDRWVNVWTELPNHDNHWLDCLVGCAVAASMQGVRVASEQEAAAEKKPRRFTQADLQRRR